MNAPALPRPSWRDWLVRAVIYAGVAGLISLWSAALGVLMALFMAVNLTHHAADTSRRRAGYRPIPRHPAMPGAAQGPLKVTPRAVLIVFAMVWLLGAVVGGILFDTTWGAALAQSLALAGLAAVATIFVFPVAAIGLLWLLSVTLGLVLSLADLAAMILVPAEQRLAWHRKVDQADHHLADLVLGQQAQIPLRADLAERAAEEAQAAKRTT